MHNENTKDTCMACSCPCDEHKVHNHDEHGHDHADGHEHGHDSEKKCSTCGQENKSDGSCGCGHK